MPGAGRRCLRSSLHLQRRLWSPIPVALVAAGIFLSSCGDDDPARPPREPGVVNVSTAEELADALNEAVAGDTIEIDPGFSNPQFPMPSGFTFEADQSPIVLRSSPRALFRPEIVFPHTADGLTFRGHQGSRILNLSLRGGRSTIVLENAAVNIDSLVITDPALDGVEASGGASTGRVRGCLIEFIPTGMGGRGGRFGVSTTAGTRLTIENNTIVEAGDCGLYVGANDVIRRNNIVRAHNFGMFFDGASTAPEVTCNNAFASTNANYQTTNNIGVPGDANYSLNPLFCPNGYRLQEFSPLAPARAGICVLIGAFGVEPDCLTEE
jgi:hypothetical protein